MTTATARRTDPITSHRAADTMNDGRLTQHEQYALGFIRKFPGNTAYQLERMAGCKTGKIWKRISGLARKGEVRRVYPDGCREGRLYPIDKNNIRYSLSLFEPDHIICDCGENWTVHGISLTGGTVTCPKCNTTAYLPERKHYE